MPKAQARKYSIELLEPRVLLSDVAAALIDPSSSSPDAICTTEVLPEHQWQSEGEAASPEDSLFAGLTLAELGGGEHGGSPEAERQSITPFSTWTAQDIPDGTVFEGGAVHQIQGNVRIPTGATLTIQPGAIVKFAAGANLEVIGTLNAIGTAESKIIFTSLKDDSAGGDTNGDGAATNPLAGDWQRIRILNISAAPATANIQHAEIRYGGRVVGSPVGSIENNNGVLTLANSVVRNSFGGGIYIPSGQGTLSNNTVSDVGQFGIQVESNGLVTLTNNAISRAASGPLRVRPTVVLSGNTSTESGLNNFIHLLGGDISDTRKWDGPLNYFLSESVSVTSTGELDLRPGLIIKLAPNREFRVAGKLTAPGTSAEPIYFTSFRDDALGGDTNGDAAATSPAAGDWYRLYVGPLFGAGNPNVNLAHTHFKFGSKLSNSPASQIYVNGGVFVMANGSVEDSFGEGIRVDAGTVTLQGNTIRNVTQIGLRIDTSEVVTITDNQIINAPWGGLRIRAGIPQTLAGNTITGSGWNNFIHLLGGSIGDARKWDQAQNYYIAETVTVTSTGSLELRPGLILKFAPGRELQVAGTLLAPGTEAEPIYFTSLKDDSVGGDTNADGNATAPAPGDWNRFYVGPISGGNPVVNVAHTHFRYGGKLSSSPSRQIEMRGGQFTLSNSSIEESFGEGITIEGGTVTLDGNTIRNVAQVGIRVANTQGVTITDNNIVNALWGWLQIGAGTPQTIAGNTVTGSGFNNFIHLTGGDIGDTRKWDQAQNYYLSETVNVGPTGKLELRPGLIIKLAPGRELRVAGQLLAPGTEADPIYLTSFKDDSVGGDTNGDADASAPAPGDWYRFYVGPLSGAGNPVANVSHTHFRFGGKLNTSPQMQIYQNGGTFSLTNSVVEQSFGDGIYVDNGTATFQGNIVRNVAGLGFRVESTDPVNFTGNAISNAVAGGIRIDAGTAQIFSGNTISGSGLNNYVQFTGGTINNARTWDFGNYFLSETVVVGTAGSVIAPAGTILKFGPAVQLTVYGQFISQGTEASPVWFTSIKDDAVGGDTNGDGAASSPVAGDWDRLYLRNDSGVGTQSGNFNYTHFRYGGKRSGGLVDAGLSMNGGTLIMRNGSVRDSFGEGIWIVGGTATIENNRIENTGRYGVRIDVNNPITLTGTTFVNAASGPLQVEVGTELTASGNSSTGSGKGNAVYMQGGGTITGTRIWNDGFTTYLLEGGLYVGPGGTLEIAPGIIVKLTPFSRVDVIGTLIALGTSEAPIIFTSSKDDSVGGDANGDGGTTTPTPGDWDRIFVNANPAAKATLDFVQILYAGKRAITAVDSSISVRDGGTIEMTRSLIRNGAGRGLWIEDGKVTFTHSRIEDIAGFGIYVADTDDRQVLTNNVITRALEGAVFQRANSDVDLSNSTWTESGRANAVFVEGGNVTGVRTWAGNLVYWISDILNIDGTLTINAGAILKLQPRMRIEVGGTLNVLGTPADGGPLPPFVGPVQITSYRDDIGGDTNGDGNTTTPGPGDIMSIWQRGGAINLNHLEIAFGGGEPSGAGIVPTPGILIDAGTATLNNATIRDALDVGLRVRTSGTLTGDGIELRNIASSGISLQGSRAVTLRNVLLENVQGEAMVVGSGSPFQIDAFELIDVAKPFMLVQGGGSVSNHLTFGAIPVVHFGGAESIGPSSTGSFTFLPGTIVKSPLNFHFNAGGPFKAVGTPDNEIIFTSIHDDLFGGDTNGNTDQTMANNGDWGGIFLNHPQARIANARILNGGKTVSTSVLDTALQIVGGVRIENVAIGGSGGNGIEVFGTGTAFIANSTISDFTTNGIVRHNATGSDLLLLNNTIVGGQTGIRIRNQKVTLTNNIFTGASMAGVLVETGTPTVNSISNIFFNPQATQGNFFHQTVPNWLPLDRRGDLTSDPIVVYDQVSDRWLVANGSPAIDSGTDPSLLADVSYQDFLAFKQQFQQPRNDTLVPNTGLGLIPYYDRGAVEKTTQGPGVDLYIEGLYQELLGRNKEPITIPGERPYFARFGFDIVINGIPGNDPFTISNDFFLQPVIPGENPKAIPDIFLGTFPTQLTNTNNPQPFTVEFPLPLLGNGFYAPGMTLDATHNIPETPFGEANNTFIIPEEFLIQNPAINPGVPLVIDPANPNIIYIPSALGGAPVRISLDSGAPVTVTLFPDPLAQAVFADTLQPGAVFNITLTPGNPTSFQQLLPPGNVLLVAPDGVVPPNSTFTVTIFEEPGGFLTDVFPRTLGNDGLATLRFMGGPFLPGAQPGLINSVGGIINPIDIQFTEETNELIVQFDFNGLPPGMHDVFVDFGEGVRPRIDRLINIVPDPGISPVTVNIVGPDVVRAGLPNEFELSFFNPGLNDIPTPVFFLDVPASAHFTLNPNGKEILDELVLFGVSGYSTNFLSLPAQSGGKIKFNLTFDPTAPVADIPIFTLPLGDPGLNVPLNLPSFLDSIGFPAGTPQNDTLRNNLAPALGTTLNSALEAMVTSTNMDPLANPGEPISPERIDAAVANGSSEMGNTLADVIGENYPVAEDRSKGDGVHRDFVVIVAIEDYSASFVGLDYIEVNGMQIPTGPIFNSNLAGTQRDANNWSDFFTNDLNIPKNQVTILRDRLGSTDDNMNLEKIRKAWQDTAAKADADDKIKFIYSGHGSANGGSMIMNTPYNSAKDQYVDGAKLKQMFADFPMPGEIYMVFDSCHSQTIGLDLNDVPRLRWNSAVSSDQLAVDGDPAAGIKSFSDFMLEGYRDQGNDLNGDDSVYISEAFKYAQRNYIAANDGPNSEDHTTPRSGGDPAVDQELHDDIGDASRDNDATGALREILKKTNPSARKRVQVAFGIDPNEKTGPAGFGQEHYIAPQEMHFAIYFENDPEKATAAAQVVTLKDQLDTDLDWNTFEFGPATVGETVIPLTSNGNSAFGEAYLIELDVIVAITGELNLESGLVTWVFRTLDPFTHLPTKDPLAGFLPPNRTKPEGEGHVKFSIQPKADLAHGAEIRNKADIVFDTNEPIITNELSYKIDIQAPAIGSVTLNGGSAARSHFDSIQIRFDDHTLTTVPLSGLSLVKVGTTESISLENAVLTQDSTANAAVLDLRQINLSAGEYQLAVAGYQVRDSGGLAMAQDYQTTFHVLAGDSTGDKVTNLFDLYRVWANQLKPANERDIAHDLNRDGQVDSADLETVRNNYLAALPAAQAGLAPQAVPLRLKPYNPPIEPAIVPVDSTSFATSFATLQNWILVSPQPRFQFSLSDREDEITAWPPISVGAEGGLL